MEYTQEQLAGFRAAYARKRRRYYIVAGVSLLVLISLSLVSKEGNVGPVSWNLLLVVWTFAVFFFSFRVWQCPACKRHLSRTARLKSCPHCGVPLV